MVGTWKTLCRELLLPDERLDVPILNKDSKICKDYFLWRKKGLTGDDPPLPEEESDDKEQAQPRRRADLPKTTNAQESLHRVYYMLCDGKCGIIAGMIQLFAFVSSLERDYEARCKGISVTYSSSNQNWQDIVTSLGMAKPTKRRYVANDGRAPDTTKELLDGAEAKSGKPSKKKGPGCPRGSLNINRSKHLGSLLKRGQNIIHKAIQALKPESYTSDKFCSADGFMDMIVDHPHTRPLFAINVTKTLICHRNDKHNRATNRSLGGFRLFPSMFRESGVAYGQLDILLKQLFSEGVLTEPGLVCRGCHPIKEKGHEQEDPTLYDQCMKIEDTSLPLHLYFLMDNIMALDSKERGRYMGDTNWPARLDIGEAKYQMVTRGFWGGNHYWCQVVRSVEGVLGVWHYDELKNGGFSQLISRDMDSLSGCIANTSWTCYMRVPFKAETVKIKHALLDMMKKFPDRHLSIPFTMPTSTMPFGGGLPSLEETDNAILTTTLPEEPSLPVRNDADADEEILNDNDDVLYVGLNREEPQHDNDKLLYGNIVPLDDVDVIGTKEADIEVDELSHQPSEEIKTPLDPVKLKIKLAIPKLNPSIEEEALSPPVASTEVQPRSKRTRNATKKADASQADDSSSAAKRKATADKRKATACKGAPGCSGEPRAA
ncbi:uncharacterized protein MELLADRAFT_89273 [Melampsora larici-populina 98AG31]|uniref:Uncharacterized protein n=1 Tax=Melampsora larici-populina (strain 98AG31 / pathotype 3-4-7) TaxID=747676 RepID=F4R5K3_MELLP|nr:uncharacterized protein MELLADRAFT_89273 [Melampsora larici-populina 98AG31]EGG12246.1 hypothetical protein MELLADRAFT_89273 [Melampsora larici-populina 98AG31]